MRRRETSFQYIRESLLQNASIFSTIEPMVFSSIYIYAHKSDETELKSFYDVNNQVSPDIKFIERVDHTHAFEGRVGFEKDSYNYWRTHLCMDFVSAMSAAMEKVPAEETNYFMWLEDDTVFTHNTPTILKEYITKNSEFKWMRCGVGATCLLFDRDTLTSVLEIVRSKWYNDIPIDLMYHLFPKSTCPSLPYITKHLGRISSRTDSRVLR
jgi:hypothetical protein